MTPRATHTASVPRGRARRPPATAPARLPPCPTRTRTSIEISERPDHLEPQRRVAELGTHVNRRWRRGGRGRLDRRGRRRRAGPPEPVRRGADCRNRHEQRQQPRRQQRLSRDGHGHGRRSAAALRGRLQHPTPRRRNARRTRPAARPGCTTGTAPAPVGCTAGGGVSSGPGTGAGTGVAGPGCGWTGGGGGAATNSVTGVSRATRVLAAGCCRSTSTARRRRIRLGTGAQPRGGENRRRALARQADDARHQHRYGDGHRGQHARAARHPRARRGLLLEHLPWRRRIGFLIGVVERQPAFGDRALRIIGRETRQIGHLDAGRHGDAHRGAHHDGGARARHLRHHELRRQRRRLVVRGVGAQPQPRQLLDRVGSRASHDVGNHHLRRHGNGDPDRGPTRHEHAWVGNLAQHRAWRQLAGFLGAPRIQPDRLDAFAGRVGLLLDHARHRDAGCDEHGHGLTDRHASRRAARTGGRWCWADRRLAKSICWFSRSCSCVTPGSRSACEKTRPTRSGIGNSFGWGGGGGPASSGGRGGGGSGGRRATKTVTVYGGTTSVPASGFWSTMVPGGARSVSTACARALEVELRHQRDALPHLHAFDLRNPDADHRIRRLALIRVRRRRRADGAPRRSAPSSSGARASLAPASDRRSCRARRAPFR